MVKKILICGDREWEDRDKIYAALKKIGKDKISCIIEGGARGADLLGKEVAEMMGLPVVEFPANWDYYKLAAGPIRNGWMLKLGIPDLVLAFHSHIEKSKGTKNMIYQAEKAGIKVRLVK